MSLSVPVTRWSLIVFSSAVVLFLAKLALFLVGMVIGFAFCYLVWWLQK